MKHAISYLRFSSRRQSYTDSYARQIEATEKFCKEKGLSLINRIEDLGVSAWTGKNLSDESALGRFLRLIEAGRIPKQTILIVENLDRLSRAKILDAMHLFTSIIKSGVEIVTTMDGKWYSEKSITENPTDLMISIIYLTRGNNESETKSLRVKQSWIRKHEKIKQGEFTKFQCPSWLSHDGTKYSLIESRAATLKLIFDLYVKGYGVYSLIQELHRRKVKPFTKSNAWKPIFIHQVLQNPAVIGVCENVMPPQPRYYPPAISEQLFYKAINQRAQNRNYRGKTGHKEVNIFGGLCKCHKCGSNMVKYSCKGKGKNASKIYNFLICSKAKIGQCTYIFTPFEKFSDSFISILHMSNFTKLLFASEPNVPDKTEIIRGKLTELDATIERVTDAIVKTDSEALVTRLAKLELDKKQLERDYETAKAENFGRTDVRDDYRELLLNLNTSLDDSEFRLRLRNLMRRHLSKIVMHSDSYKVYFSESVYGDEDRDTIQVHLADNHFELAYWEELEAHGYDSFRKQKDTTRPKAGRMAKGRAKVETKRAK
jgi:DNA invertase Pin-like site-specific DNA recombinase